MKAVGLKVVIKSDRLLKHIFSRAHINNPLVLF
jgi:hypothetical protein